MQFIFFSHFAHSCGFPYFVSFVERDDASGFIPVDHEECEADIEHGACRTLVDKGTTQVDNRETAGFERPGARLGHLAPLGCVFLVQPFDVFCWVHEALEELKTCVQHHLLSFVEFFQGEPVFELLVVETVGILALHGQ